MNAWEDLSIVARGLQREMLGDKYERDLERWRDDPCAFVWDVFGYKPWRRQVEILESVRDNKRTAVRSGHKVSKSNSASVVGYWWCVTRPEGRVITTATTGKQITKIIWREVRALYRKSLQVGRLWLPRPAIQPSTGLSWSDGREFIGMTAENTEALSGLSGPDMLFIVDEASGVHDDIYVAIRGNMAGGASLLLISNPSQPTGPFYDAFHDHKELYNCIHISSEESPNILWDEQGSPYDVDDDQLIRGLARADYVLESRVEYGPNWQSNPLYHVRVLGNFPLQSEMCIFGVGTVQAAIARWIDAVAEGPLHIGVDVAHFGDDETVLQSRRGLKHIDCTAVHGYEEKETACMVVRMCRLHWKLGEPWWVEVKIDTGGGYGTELASRLRDPDDKCWTHDWVTDGTPERNGEWRERETPHPWGMGRPPVNVHEVNGSTACEIMSPVTGEPEFVDLRSQLWFGGEKWLREGGAILNDKRLSAELIAPTYTIERNKRRAEPKKDVKKRIKRSPDRADAFNLMVYEPSDLMVTGTQAATEVDDRWGVERGYG